MKISELSKHSINASYFFFFFAVPHGMRNFPAQGSNPRPQHCKRGILTTGPGKSNASYFYHVMSNQKDNRR